MSDTYLKLKILFYYLITGESYDGWRDNIWDKNLDDFYCCDGQECGCGAETIREVWNKYSGC